ncbi:DNA polymerase III subunit delta [Shewanella vesiculosa]|jgi:DNA polymerase-3 subunit delta|uniref:DNA polymerase III subunit delta n=1 Tax=Shewanella vesiculosa TaxID=518738 RepID=A0ABV0FNT2_9GAMM|nr:MULTISPECIES: DNA polymerase III subunit delta [unclassified Shewanella]MBB1321125.1 DNA polymerase III subunit delta [Shewanella sp. SR43-8]MBB1474047.1 DNA polymerase III subunit delta [Shewanella sp. SG41-3]|tara:strand:+ start:2942 stop:3976 length:1035 start_codon:yes stop_codon:yes gene_type:complete
MRVYPDQLKQHLSPLPQCFLLFGDDPWLIENSKQHILSAAKKQGFEERVQLSQETGFNWGDLVQEWQAMSLFASRRIVELTLPQGKPGIEGAAAFQTLLQHPNPDMLLIVQGPKASAEQTNSKWFKSLDAKGIYLPCATPEGKQFERWLDSRITHYQLTVHHDAKAMLFTLFEGNLLAGEQAMQLLQLLSPKQNITPEQLSEYFEDQSRFSVFQLCDAILGNHQKHAQHMLAQLQAEGTAMPILMWALFKEINLLLTLKLALHNGEQLSKLWGQHRIWDKRKPLYQAAITRLDLDHIEHMLAFASQLELNLKQKGHEDWIGLSHLCILFDPRAHKRLAHIELTD